MIAPASASGVRHPYTNALPLMGLDNSVVMGARGIGKDTKLNEKLKLSQTPSPNANPRRY